MRHLYTTNAIKQFNLFRVFRLYIKSLFLFAQKFKISRVFKLILLTLQMYITHNYKFCAYHVYM